MTVNHYSAIFPILVFLMTYGLVFFVRTRQSKINLGHRETAMDGLRGILALMVVFCHAGCWHTYVTTAEWIYPEPLFFYLGNTGVTLFFMITAFLFTSKLLNHNTTPISWSNLYASRLLRVYPLYLVVVCLVVLIALIETGFKLNVTSFTFAKDIFKWIAFTMFGEGHINDYQNTSIIIASVQWTLIYEWFFYLALPIMGVFFCKNKAYGTAIICTLLLGILLLTAEFVFSPKAFLTGILAAVFYKKLKMHAILRRPLFGLLAIILIILQFTDFFQLGPKNQQRLGIIFLSIAFLIVAHGNDLLGFLNTKAMRFLGDISYGIYLIHGLVYFCIYKYALGVEVIKTATPIHYWLIVYAVTIVTVYLAYLSHRFIEMPAMKHVKPFAAWIKKQTNVLGCK